MQAMQHRNYMYANDIYLRLAIGNAPWPIGVTSVGIHERSAREKISHVMNQHGQAHIMNDEATRKYLQVQCQVLGLGHAASQVQGGCAAGQGRAGQGSLRKCAALQAHRRACKRRPWFACRSLTQACACRVHVFALFVCV